MTNKSRFSYIKSNFFLKNLGRPSQSKVKATHGDNTQSANPQHSIECKTKTQNVFFRFLSQNEKKVVLLHPLSRGKESQNGLLAQLVQSASFTRKRSTVRICNRPPRKGFEWSLFLFYSQTTYKVWKHYQWGTTALLQEDHSTYYFFVTAGLRYELHSTIYTYKFFFMKYKKGS